MPRLLTAYLAVLLLALPWVKAGDCSLPSADCCCNSRPAEVSCCAAPEAEAAPPCRCHLRAAPETPPAPLPSASSTPEAPRLPFALLPTPLAPLFRTSENHFPPLPNFGTAPPARHRALLQRWRC